MNILIFLEPFFDVRNHLPFLAIRRFYNGCLLCEGADKHCRAERTHDDGCDEEQAIVEAAKIGKYLNESVPVALLFKACLAQYKFEFQSAELICLLDSSARVFSLMLERYACLVDGTVIA